MTSTLSDWRIYAGALRRKVEHSSWKSTVSRLLFKGVVNFIMIRIESLYPNLMSCQNETNTINYPTTDPKTRQLVQNHFKSQMADQICYAILCVFSYVAAGQSKNATLPKDQISN